MCAPEMVDVTRSTPVDALAFAGLVALAATPAMAADPEPLDEEFLEYLAEFESRDDWSWFDAHPEKEGERKQVRKPTLPTAPAASSTDKGRQP